ncbi:MAG: sulfotransferase family protein [Saprospiraceae bacterium]|nr:sulfotransferase family protein [Saprospiraceae bacterium]
MSIKIIGAGLPRTGTNTLKASLEMLGFTKTYHMKELLVHPENLHYWTTLRDTGTMQWDKLYDGYQATVDFPCCPWYKEHMAQYPDAKVIFTTRPFEGWYTSIYSTIWKAGPQTIGQKLGMMIKLLLNPRLRSVIKCVKFAKSSIFGGLLHGKFENKAATEKIFDQWMEDVKAAVPADKLLIFDVRDGWSPLCKFLGVPEPPEPLPHLNKKENFKTMLVELMKGNMV